MSAASTSRPSRAPSRRTGPPGPGDPEAPSRPFWPWVVLALLLVAGMAWWVSRSPLFRLRTLEVSGQSHLSRQEVVRLSGLGEHTNVLWLSAGSVEARLEADPWIERAAVRRALPTTVRVEVVERVPAATVRAGPSSWLLVAADGTVLEEVGADPGLPAIVAVDTPRVGERPAALVDPARAVAAMGQWVRARVGAVRLLQDGSLVLLLEDGTRVLYGEPAQLGAKAQSLFAVLRWTLDHGVRLAAIDLRSPRSPAGLTPSTDPEASPAT